MLHAYVHRHRFKAQHKQVEQPWRIARIGRVASLCNEHAQSTEQGHRKNTEDAEQMVFERAYKVTAVDSSGAHDGWHPAVAVGDVLKSTESGDTQWLRQHVCCNATACSERGVCAGHDDTTGPRRAHRVFAGDQGDVGGHSGHGGLGDGGAGACAWSGDLYEVVMIGASMCREREGEGGLLYCQPSTVRA